MNQVPKRQRVRPMSSSIELCALRPRFPNRCQHERVIRLFVCICACGLHVGCRIIKINQREFVVAFVLQLRIFVEFFFFEPSSRILCFLLRCKWIFFGFAGSNWMFLVFFSPCILFGVVCQSTKSTWHIYTKTE